MYLLYTCTIILHFSPTISTVQLPFLQQQSFTIYTCTNYITPLPHYTTTIFIAAKFHSLHLYNYITLIPPLYSTTTIFTTAKFHPLCTPVQFYYTSPPLHNHHFYNSKFSLSTPVQFYYTSPPTIQQPFLQQQSFTLYTCTIILHFSPHYTTTMCTPVQCTYSVQFSRLYSKSKINF